MNPVETFEKLSQRSGPTELAELDAFFDALAAVPPSAMLGAWAGGVFVTGHVGEKQLVAMKWVGKDFHGANDVDPIVVRGEGDARVASDVLGKATLRNVEYRGVVTATMVYDKQPVFDHFRRIDDGLVLGCMDRKGDAFPLYFWLRKI